MADLETQAEELRAFLVGRVIELTGCDPSEFEEDWPLAASGMSSRDAVVLSGEMEERLQRELSPTILWEYPTIGALVRHLTAEGGQ